MDYQFLLRLAVILLCTKLLGILTKRVSLPQVVGALIAGVLLGPACFGLIGETTFLDQIAELGVIVLMFTAGLETDLDGLKRSGKAAFVIALIGVIVPLAAGFAVACFFNRGEFLQNVFIGVILTATSVSITVETLKELGKLSTRSGNAILGAALIDDVLGIVALTIVTSMAGQGAGIGIVLLKIVLFFALSLVVGVVLHKLVQKWFETTANDKRRFLVVAFALCLLYAYVAEDIFGVADITGAYIMGVIFAGTPKVAYLENRFDTLSCMLLSPVFFASIGLKVVLPQMSGAVVLFSVLLILAAVASKVVGCGLGARFCGYTGKDALRIGVGMISRGEVALIVANKGIASGLMNDAFFGPVVLVVIVTTVITPILLKLVYKSKEKDYSDLEESELVNRYEDRQDFDLASQMLLDDHDTLQEKKPRK
ncbi:cation:proton antiporter [Pseudoflavonifractor phocaeensis]|uniref:cation:proton antiporter n=1 Tax=Pseudoflavonifractor phocaeensis TaxID=1870988 RepID=UPI00313D1BCB